MTRRTPPRAWTTSEIARLRELTEDGEERTAGEIAALLGRSVLTVYQTAYRHGIKLSRLERERAAGRRP